MRTNTLPIPAGYYFDEVGNICFVDHQGHLAGLADSAVFTAFPPSVRAEGAKPAMVVAAVGALTIAGLAVWALVANGRQTVRRARS